MEVDTRGVALGSAAMIDEAAGSRVEKGGLEAYVVDCPRAKLEPSTTARAILETMVNEDR